MYYHQINIAPTVCYVWNCYHTASLAWEVIGIDFERSIFDVTWCRMDQLDPIRCAKSLSRAGGPPPLVATFGEHVFINLDNQLSASTLCIIFPLLCIKLVPGVHRACAQLGVGSHTWGKNLVEGW